MAAHIEISFCSSSNHPRSLALVYGSFLLKFHSLISGFPGMEPIPHSFLTALNSTPRIFSFHDDDRHENLKDDWEEARFPFFSYNTDVLSLHPFSHRCTNQLTAVYFTLVCLISGRFGWLHIYFGGLLALPPSRSLVSYYILPHFAHPLLICTLNSCPNAFVTPSFLHLASFAALSFDISK